MKNSIKNLYLKWRVIDEENTLYTVWLEIIVILQSVFLLLVRLYWGYGFIQAGLGKFRNFDRTVAFFDSVNIPFASLNVCIASGTEVLGGLLLLLGLGSRITTIPLIFTMIVAYITTEYGAVINIFNAPDDFLSAEPFLYLLVSVIVFLFGAGKYSADTLVLDSSLHVPGQKV